LLRRNPTAGIAGCCARAASEQAAISLANKAPACAPFT
jgi:hypothetical protein